MPWKEVGKLLIPDGTVDPVVAESEQGEKMTAGGLIVPKDVKPEPPKPNREMRRNIVQQIKAMERRERRRKLRVGKVIDNAADQLASIHLKQATSPSE